MTGPAFATYQKGRTTQITKARKSPVWAIALGFLCSAAQLCAPGQVVAQENIPAPQSVGSGASTESFGDWTVTCGLLPADAGGDATKLCELRHDAGGETPDVPKASLAFQADASRSDVSVSILTPLNLIALEPVLIALPDGSLYDFSLQTCFPRGCVATGSMTAADLDKFRAAKEPALLMVTATEELLEVELSLSGFEEAWSSMAAEMETDGGVNIDSAAKGPVIDDVNPLPVTEQSAGRLPAPDATISSTAPSRPFTQVGLFQMEANAQAALGRIEAAGLNGRIIPTELKGRSFWRVLVGPARDASENASFLAKSRSLGFTDAYHVRN